MERIAQCQCGSLRAIAAGEPGSVYLCHCKACQRRTGTIVHTGAYYPKENVRFEGPSNVYTRVAATGFAVHFHFCPTCGTSVDWISDKRPKKFLGLRWAVSLIPLTPHPRVLPGRKAWLPGWACRPRRVVCVGA